MKVIVTCEIEDTTTREDMAKVGLTDTLVKRLAIASFTQLLEAIASEGATARVTAVELVDNAGEGAET